MEQSPSWKANWFSATQEIPRILWKHLSLLPVLTHSKIWQSKYVTFFKNDRTFPITSRNITANFTLQQAALV